LLMARAAAPMFSGFRVRTSTTRKRSNSVRIAGLNSSRIGDTLQNPADCVYARPSLRLLMLMPFRAKGAVLKGASARVHGVSPAGASGESRKHYLVEVTITPSDPKGPFSLWEPGELRLVRPESVLRPYSGEPDDEDNECTITRIQIEDEGQWKDDEGMKYGRGTPTTAARDRSTRRTEIEVPLLL
jgi:hypothetical protein